MLYTILFKPFEVLIGKIFIWLEGFVPSIGISLILLSLIVSTLVLPLYLLVERVQEKERKVQLAMKPKIDEFKSVHKGYERYLYINEVYRRHNYHPVYALRGLLGLLIQIPFFIGAYSFLSHYPGIQGVSFLFLQDLGLPDHLLPFGLNVLPFVMTAANLASGYVYGRKLSLQENLNIIVIAVVFLVILFSAPSGLLVYWTCNNLYSLVKNLILNCRGGKS